MCHIGHPLTPLHLQLLFISVVLYIPKHVRHLLAFPISPKRAPGRGAAIVPQVSQEQIVDTEFELARCAMFLRVLTTNATVTAGSTLSSVFTGIEVLEVTVLFVTGAAF